MTRVHLDGALFKDLFGTPEMRSVFGEERFVERFLEVEAALARAEAAEGIVPEWAAEELTAKASLEHVDLDEVAANVAEIHLFTMAIIEAWKAEVGDAGEYVHWGATSQDVSDTALVLQVREGLGVVRRDLEVIADVLAELVERHADTPTAGRTHHVHALPTTVGLKAASWLDEVRRHLDRLDGMEERLYAVEFFGAVGTLASLGEDGLAVQERLAEELDLAVPDVAWFAARDRLAELLDFLATVTATLARVAKNVLVLNRPVVGELGEPIPEGEVGSSTMPHKRNPVKSEETVMLDRLVRAHASTMHELMTGLDERDASTWLAEFAVVPEAFLYTSRALENVHETLAGLVVDEERMAENLGHFGDLLGSEAVMMDLAAEVGRQTAHDVVHDAAMAALDDEAVDFAARVADDPRTPADVTRERVVDAADPTGYTGVAERLARRVIEE
ncbi:MAG: adenylosuccinate lyase family protein [Haloferacaceae archaeon]